MEFRYDFGKKLDLSRFRKQLLSSLKAERRIDFRIYTNQYQLYLQQAHTEKRKTYIMHADLYELVRDSDGEIFTSNRIFPESNPKLKGFSIMQKVFSVEGYGGIFIIEDPEITVKEIIELIKVLHKWEDLKAFL